MRSARRSARLAFPLSLPASLLGAALFCWPLWGDEPFNNLNITPEKPRPESRDEPPDEPERDSEPDPAAAEPTGNEIELEVRDLEGWQVHIDVRLLSGEHAELGRRAISMLANRLMEVRMLVAPSRVERLEEVPIWLDYDHPPLREARYYGASMRQGGPPMRMARSIHIPKASLFLDYCTRFGQPQCVLHELAHAYHDRVLGFNHAGIQDMYNRAVEEHLYDEVLNYNGRMVRHYALTNCREYFAEATEAYFSRNETFPFVRAELRDHDPRMYRLMEALWLPPR